MPKCIFCENELTPDTTPEHVLLSALGGRMTTKKAICSEHNNAFGGTIDRALAAQVEAIRNHLQLQSGTKKPPPPLKNLTAGSEKISIGSDGVSSADHASFGTVCGIRLKPQRIRGHTRIKAAPKSNAAAALPAHFAQAPPTTGPNIMQA
jgi:HNH endonuclease